MQSRGARLAWVGGVMKTGLAKDMRWNLSKDKNVIFTHGGVYFLEDNDRQYFISHNELKTLNKLRKKYNYLFKDELMIEREEPSNGGL